MDTLGIIATGVGAFLMFEAVKNKAPKPIVRARQILSAANPQRSKSSTGSATFVPPATGAATALGA